MGALHGVDGHFDLVSPPTPTGSGWVSLRSTGISELAARRAGDAILPRAAPAVVTLSLRWSDQPSAVAAGFGFHVRQTSSRAVDPQVQPARSPGPHPDRVTIKGRPSRRTPILNHDPITLPG